MLVALVVLLVLVLVVVVVVNDNRSCTSPLIVVALSHPVIDHNGHHIIHPVIDCSLDGLVQLSPIKAGAGPQSHGL